MAFRHEGKSRREEEWRCGLRPLAAAQPMGRRGGGERRGRGLFLCFLAIVRVIIKKSPKLQSFHKDMCKEIWQANKSFSPKHFLVIFTVLLILGLLFISFSFHLEESNDSIALKHFHKGVSYSREGLYSEAIGEFSQAIYKNPDFADAYFQRGITFSQYENYREKALEDYNRTLEIKPDYFDVFIHRALVHLLRGYYDLAIEDSSLAIENDLDNARLYHVRGMSYLGQGLYQEAITDFSQGIHLNPDDYRIYLSRADAYRKVGLDDLAKNDITKAHELENR